MKTKAIVKKGDLVVPDKVDGAIFLICASSVPEQPQCARCKFFSGRPVTVTHVTSQLAFANGADEGLPGDCGRGNIHLNLHAIKKFERNWVEI
jgi:hypothetical protein